MTHQPQALQGSTDAPEGATLSEYPKTKICKWAGCKRPFVIERKNPGTERLFCCKRCRQAHDKDVITAIRDAGRQALKLDQQPLSA
jgi:hypothetical protein